MCKSNKTMKIYTKTGDTGITRLIGNVRVAKNDRRLEAYGTVDELNSFVGLLASSLTDVNEIEFIKSIQRRLFALGADLATPSANRKQIRITSVDTVALERAIDHYMAVLPPMTGFVLPTGNMMVGYAHVCRSITRRLERRMYDVHQIEPLPAEWLCYVNRLSDYFFVLARKFAHDSRCETFL